MAVRQGHKLTIAPNVCLAHASTDVSLLYRHVQLPIGFMQILFTRIDLKTRDNYMEILKKVLRAQCDGLSICAGYDAKVVCWNAPTVDIGVVGKKAFLHIASCGQWQFHDL